MIEKIKIDIPTKCPACSSNLRLINSQLFCDNEACDAQTSKKLESFTKSLKIKGFGPKTLEKLGAEDPLELVLLSQDYLVCIMGDKIGIKLKNELDKLKGIDFATFLSGLSIPSVGISTAKKIASVCNTPEDLEQVDNLPIGEAAKEKVWNWYLVNSTYYYSLASALEVTFDKVTKSSIEGTKGKVCITGKLKDFANRREAGEYLTSLGYTITTTVSKQTNYLVDEEGRESSKSKKAKQLGIKIVTIDELRKI